MVVASFIAFLLIEIVVRVWRVFRETFLEESFRRQDFLDPRYHEYINWTDTWNKPMFTYIPVGMRVFNDDNPITPVTTNSLGFRCPEFRAKVKGEYRIVILGGSAAWGFGASGNDTTIAGHLERICREQQPALPEGFDFVSVWNMAQVNQTQTQDILTATLLLPDLIPDTVISFTGWNELVGSATMDLRFLENYSIFPINELVGWSPMQMVSNTKNILIDTFFTFFSRKFDAINWLQSKRNVRAPLIKRSIPEASAIATPLYLKNLKKLVSISKAFDFEHFQFLQPNFYRKLHPSPIEARAIDLYDEHRPVLGGKATGDFLRNNNIYQSLIDAVNGPDEYGQVIDLSDIFYEEQETMFYSPVHCTDAGYELIAQRMYGTIFPK